MKCFTSKYQYLRWNCSSKKIQHPGVCHRSFHLHFIWQNKMFNWKKKRQEVDLQGWSRLFSSWGSVVTLQIELHFRLYTGRVLWLNKKVSGKNVTETRSRLVSVTSTILLEAHTKLEVKQVFGKKHFAQMTHHYRRLCREAAALFRVFLCLFKTTVTGRSEQLKSCRFVLIRIECPTFSNMTLDDEALWDETASHFLNKERFSETTAALHHPGNSGQTRGRKEKCNLSFSSPDLCDSVFPFPLRSPSAFIISLNFHRTLSFFKMTCSGAHSTELLLHLFFFRCCQPASLWC